MPNMLNPLTLDRIASPIPSDDAPDLASIHAYLLLTHTPSASMPDADILDALRDGMSVSDIVNAMLDRDSHDLVLDADARDEYTRRVRRIIVRHYTD